VSGLIKTGRRLDGSHGCLEGQLCDQLFENFTEILSWNEPRPEGGALSFGRSHVWCTQFPYLMLARPDHDDWHPDVWIWTVILALWMSAPERVAAIFRYLCFGKKSWSFGQTLSVIQTGCWIVRTDASWSSLNLLDIEEGPDGNPRRPDRWCFSLMGIQMVWHVVQTAGALDRDSWAPGQYDTSSRRLVGNWIFWLANCAESSGKLLNSGIPVKKHILKEVILSNRMWPITN